MDFTLDDEHFDDVYSSLENSSHYSDEEESLYDANEKLCDIKEEKPNFVKAMSEINVLPSCIQLDNSHLSVKTDTKTKDLASIVKSECGICTDMCAQDKMFVPICCDHKICRPCAEQYYETQIRNKGILDVTCPHHSCTDLLKFDAMAKQEYFALTSSQLKEFLSTEVMDLFERKLRDWSISSMADFMWCPKCENGVIVDDMESQSYTTCSHCGCNICIECKKEWTKVHAKLTCQQYQKWQETNDVLGQDKKLDKYLLNHGIECPKCKMQFIKPSGGCLHLKCPMSGCHHEFCEGCHQPFTSGKKCQESSKCVNMGMHAHHPRNCFYFLRDWEPTKLQNLLRSHTVCFDSESLNPVNYCQIIEQKDTTDGLADEACGKDVEPYQAGYCRKHYVRYLGQLVLDHGIDPVLEYDVEELELYFMKHNFQLPLKNQDYRLEMIKIIQNLGDMSLYRTTLTAKEKGFDADLLKDSDSESEDGLFEYAVGACASRTEHSNLSVWRCAFCTYDNPIGTPICEMCCRTQLLNGEFEVYEDGIECFKCTLINSTGSVHCLACGSVLEKQILNCIEELNLI